MLRDIARRNLHSTQQRNTTMTRIPTPASIEASPQAAQPLLQAVKKQLGVVPNMFRAISNSPAALEGYLGLNGALAKGSLEPQTRERIALAIAEVNGCDYCLSAHAYLGKNLSKLSDAEIAANRDGGSTDAKADAAVRFAAKLAQTRGHPSGDDVNAVKRAGYTDAQVIEIVLHVALNTLTNYINETVKTEVDFPVMTTRAHAA
jgi:uncharacterized peroxidase-related enzyme